MALKLKKYENQPFLPRIFLGYIQSLYNNLNELRSMLVFQWDTKNCNIVVLMEALFHLAIPNSVIMPAGRPGIRGGP